jgi:hypothetical protein
VYVLLYSTNRVVCDCCSCLSLTVTVTVTVTSVIVCIVTVCDSRDASTATTMIVGGTMGASSLPILMNVAIQLDGPTSMLAIVLACICALVAILAVLVACKDRVYRIGRKQRRQQQEHLAVLNHFRDAFDDNYDNDDECVEIELRGLHNS